MSIVEAEHPAGVPVSVSVEIGGKEISFESGKMAKQADGAVIVRSGETVVLGTARSSNVKKWRTPSPCSGLRSTSRLRTIPT